MVATDQSISPGHASTRNKRGLAVKQPKMKQKRRGSKLKTNDDATVPQAGRQQTITSLLRVPTTSDDSATDIEENLEREVRRERIIPLDKDPLLKLIRDLYSAEPGPSKRYHLRS